MAYKNETMNVHTSYDVNTWNSFMWTADWNDFLVYDLHSYDCSLSRSEKGLNETWNLTSVMPMHCSNYQQKNNNY